MPGPLGMVPTEQNLFRVPSNLIFMFEGFLTYAPVAQLDRALPSGGRGLGFESLRAHHFFNISYELAALT